MPVPARTSSKGAELPTSSTERAATLYGRAGNDELFGGSGKDRLYGGTVMTSSMADLERIA